MAMNDPTGGQDPGAPGAGGTNPSWDPQTRAYIESLRRENAGHRFENKQLKAQVASENRALKIELALAESPDLDGLDRRYVKYLLAEEKKLDDLGPNAADFRERLKDRISDVIGRNPEVRAGARSRVPPTTSGVPSGGPGGPTDNQLTYADLRSMSDDAIAAAHKQGRTNWLLGRRP